MNHRLHEPSGQKNKRSVTADYNAVGVRPSSGAASTGCCDASDSIGARSRSDIAAPEDGRTPPRRSPAVADPVRFCAELHSIGDFELEHVFRNHTPSLVTHLSPKRVGATARSEPFRGPHLPR